MSNGLLAILGLLVTALGIGVPVLVARMNVRGQAHQSEEAHARELERDAATARRQQLQMLRDWHAQQFDIVLEASKLYNRCCRTVHIPEDELEDIRNARIKAEQLINDVIFALSREPGNSGVRIECIALRGNFLLYEDKVNRNGAILSLLGTDSEDADKAELEIRARRRAIWDTTFGLQKAIQERLGELDAQMK